MKFRLLCSVDCCPTTKSWLPSVIISQHKHANGMTENHEFYVLQTHKRTKLGEEEEETDSKWNSTSNIVILCVKSVMESLFDGVPCRRFPHSHTCDNKVVSVLIRNWRYLMTKISVEFPPVCCFLDKLINSYIDMMKVKESRKYIIVKRWIVRKGIVGVTCVIYEWFVIAFVTGRHCFVSSAA